MEFFDHGRHGINGKGLIGMELGLWAWVDGFFTTDLHEWWTMERFFEPQNGTELR